jgi:excisionase family DNA binding protein
MIDLHSTREAAEYLQVSEASVRRWSDAGLLAVQRIGHRRTRRFARAELERFADAGRREAGPAVAARPDAACRIGAARLSPHTHVAAFYDSDAGRLPAAVAFIADGLRAGQPCLLVASGRVLDLYLGALRRSDGVDVEAAIATGRLITLAGPGATARTGIRRIEDLVRSGLAGGAPLMRLVGEVASARAVFRSDAELREFELGLTAFTRRFPIVFLCQYDVREFSGQDILEALRSHPDLFDLRLGNFLG